MASLDSSQETLSRHGLTHQSYSFPTETEPINTHLLRKSELSKNLSIHMTHCGPVLDGHGTPSYPSPLDRIRTGRRERAAQFGLYSDLHDSFEANQSFPKTKKTSLHHDVVKPAVKVKLSDFKGHGLNDVSFSAGHSRGSFMSPSDGEMLLGDSWSFYKYIGHTSSRVTFPTTVRNPNKAICMVNAQTSQILIVNEMACELFGYKEEELLTMHLRDLIKLKSKQQATISESHIEETTGSIIDVSGKVVDAIDYTGLCVPISLWVKSLPHEETPRCLVVMEPVERTVASVQFDTQGLIVSCDSAMLQLYGYTQIDDITGLHINQLIPALKLPTTTQQIPKELIKQRATGRSRAGGTFPLSIALKLSHFQQECVFEGVVWVFANISGLITFLPDGSIHSINENFALMMFGYTPDELIGKDISTLIPDFYKIIEDEHTSVMSLPERTANGADISTNSHTTSHYTSADTSHDVSRDMSHDISVNSSFGASWDDASFITISDSSECATSTPCRPHPKPNNNPKLRNILKQSAHSGEDFTGPLTPDCNSHSSSEHCDKSANIDDQSQETTDNFTKYPHNTDVISNEAEAILSTFSTYKPRHRFSDSGIKHNSLLHRGRAERSLLEKMSRGSHSLNMDSMGSCDLEVEKVVKNGVKNTHAWGNFNNSNSSDFIANFDSENQHKNKENDANYSNVGKDDDIYLKIDDSNTTNDEMDSINNDSSEHIHAKIDDDYSSNSDHHSHKVKFSGLTSPKLGRSPRHRRKLTRTPHQNWLSASERGSVSPIDLHLSATPSPIPDQDKQSSARHVKLAKSPNFLTVDSPGEYYENCDAPYVSTGRSFCLSVTPPQEYTRSSRS